MALFVPVILIVLMVLVPFVIRRLTKGQEHPHHHFSERVIKPEDVRKTQAGQPGTGH